MRGTPLTANNSPIARSAPARAQSQRTQERRRALIVSCGILFVVGLGFVLVTATEFPMPAHPTKSSQTASEAPDNNLGSAKVTIESADGKGCRQQVFDNQTGRMTRSQQPCETTAYDNNGAQLPLGTMHRLDAISKSFLGK
jgi:hypothetical protein